MGMFDDINYEAPCPICSTPLTGWQSKDAGCGLGHLTPAQLWEQSADTREGGNRNNGYEAREYAVFYQGCHKCGTWVEVRLSPGVLDFTEDDFRRLRNGEKLERRRGPVLPVASEDQP